MSPSSRAVLPGLLLAALLPGCLKPGPRIPFDTDRGYMVLATASERWTDDRYVHGYTPFGIEVVSLTPGTAGWGWEFSAHYGEDTGEDKERKVFKGNFPPPPNGSGQSFKNNISVPVERDSEFYEVSAGVRQSYFPDSRLQPYFGVGMSLFYIHQDDDLEGTFVITNPNFPGESVTVGVVDETDRVWNFGLYSRVGLAWRLFGDPDGKRVGTFFTTDVRGLWGTYFNSVELVFGFGFGR